MPYNLRKRKVPEVVVAEPPKKRATQPKKEQPPTPQPKEEPVTAKPKEQPVTTKPKEQPVTTKPKEQPVTAKPKEEPVIAKPKETPVAKKERETTKSKRAPATKKPKKELEVKELVTKHEEDEDIIQPIEEEEEAANSEPEKELVVEKPIEEPIVSKKKKEADIKQPVTETITCNQLVFGADSCGELGFKKIGFRKKVPSPVPMNEKIKQVSCGPMHTVSLTESGVVYTYGCNDEGALGRETDGDEDLESTPTTVPLKAKVIKVTAGDSHSAALTDDNRVFVWGNFRDEHGSVGLTPDCNGEASTNPIQILPGTQLKDIASGSNHMLLLDVDGIVYSFGVGAQGQLGRLGPDYVGGENDKATKITAENRNLFLTPQEVSFVNVDPKTKFVCDAVYAGNFSSFATNTDKKKNRLAGWGLNNYFQLGFKGQAQNTQHFPKRSTFTCSTSMIDVACGQHHTLFLTRTGRVYVAGRHQYGMLGLGDEPKEVCPAKHIESLPKKVTSISAGINTSFAVSEDGKLFSWGMSGPSLGVDGDDDLKVPTEVEKLADKTVISVSTGGSFTAVLVK